MGVPAEAKGGREGVIGGEAFIALMGQVIGLLAFLGAPSREIDYGGAEFA